ncbi:ADP-heptose synthase [Pseudolabrys sp. Root1462]|nr:ADP-heptose synthase [Pseudolabrys sp. Root1462]
MGTGTLSTTASDKYSEVAKAIRLAAGTGRRIAFVSGNFNVIHPGHLRLFKFAKDLSDFLVVGVNADRAPGTSVKLADRLEGLEALSVVDQVVALDGLPDEFVLALQPDIVVKGSEFEKRVNREQAAVDSYGGKLIFSSGEMRFASIGLLQQEFKTTNIHNIRKSPEYMRRHGVTHAAVTSTLRQFSGMKIFVIGDVIVDDYITCDPLGMSQEDPTIVVAPIETRTFIGGAGIVAAHARGLGADVDFCTVVGNDGTAKFVTSDLERLGVKFNAFVDMARPTTRKQRFRALNKTLLRVNHLRQNPIEPGIQSKMLSKFDEVLDAADLVLFSCFNYGCLPQALVDEMSARARKKGVMMAADSQASSQMADVSRFQDMSLITPTEREARLALQDFDTGLAYIGERLQCVAKARNLIISLGAEGMLIRGPKENTFQSDRLHAINTSPKDVAGAGDSLFTSTSMALCAGREIWEAAYIGAVAAAVQVSRVGNSPLNVRELIAEIDGIDHASDDAFEL